MINIRTPEHAAEFSAKIAGVVTFDFPLIDFDFVFGWIAGFELPKFDPIMTDLRQESISDETLVDGVRW